MHRRVIDDMKKESSCTLFLIKKIQANACI